MRTPKNFIATYECEECGEEIEMQNFYAPYVNLPCEDCGTQTKHLAQTIEHKSFDWDRIED